MPVDRRWHIQPVVDADADQITFPPPQCWRRHGTVDGHRDTFLPGEIHWQTVDIQFEIPANRRGISAFRNRASRHAEPTAVKRGAGQRCAQQAATTNVQTGALLISTTPSQRTRYRYNDDFIGAPPSRMASSLSRVPATLDHLPPPHTLVETAVAAPCRITA